MYLDEFLSDHLDYKFLEPEYHSFWIDLMIDSLALLGPDSDSDLERLCRMFIDHCAAKTVSAQLGKQINQVIVTVRGVAYYQDDSCIGLKYRSLVTIADTIQHSRCYGGTPLDRYRDEDTWFECIYIVFVYFINFDEDKDAILLERVKVGSEFDLGSGDV